MFYDSTVLDVWNIRRSTYDAYQANDFQMPTTTGKQPVSQSISQSVSQPPIWKARSQSFS